MNKAFSLVELSIVLVILGLLTGGILAGQNLIRAAELRSVSAGFDRYVAAANTFRDKYFALPGDMRNATKFWGAQAGSTADGVNTTCQNLDNANPATGAATCNGDGNGRITDGWGNIAYTPQFEVFRAWHHLANAGLIEGSYAGVTDSTINSWSSGPVTTPSWNVPAGKISNTGYLFGYFGSINGVSQLFDGNYGNTLIFGGTGCIGSVHHCYTYAPIISPEEAWNIDTKMDDGKPAYGKLVSPTHSVNPNCATTTTPATAEYEVQDTGKNCALILKKAI